MRWQVPSFPNRWFLVLFRLPCMLLPTYRPQVIMLCAGFAVSCSWLKRRPAHDLQVQTSFTTIPLSISSIQISAASHLNTDSEIVTSSPLLHWSGRWKPLELNHHRPAPRLDQSSCVLCGYALPAHVTPQSKVMIFVSSSVVLVLPSECEIETLSTWGTATA